MLIRKMAKGLLCAGFCLAGVIVGAAEPYMTLTGTGKPSPARIQILSQKGVVAGADGLVFDGRGSYLQLRTPDKLSAVTIALQVNCNGGAAGDQAMVARRGFHNFLGCDRDGHPVLEIWNAAQNERIRLVGTSVLEPGKWYNLAGVVGPDATQTRLTLYVDGKSEAEKSFSGQPYAYENELLIGGCNPWSSTVANMFPGKLNSVRVYAEALTAENVAATVLPLPQTGGSVAPAVTPQAVAPAPVTKSEAGIKVFENLQYGQAGGVALVMDLAMPDPVPQNPVPAIVFIHGGGWGGGDRQSMSNWIRLLAREGFVTATIEYRLASATAPFPAQLQDCKAAVRFLRSNAAKYQIDPQRIGAMGCSAGGHLASMLGLTDGIAEFEGDGGWNQVSSRVQAVCDCFGPSDFTTWEAVVNLFGKMKKSANWSARR